MAIRNKGMTGGSASATNGEMTVEQFKKWLTTNFDEDKDSRKRRVELVEDLNYAEIWCGWRKIKLTKRATDGNWGRFMEDHEKEKLVEYARKHLGMKINL